MENNKRVGMSFLGWILSILMIIIFLSFIVLPPTFRIVFSEKEEEIDYSGIASGIKDFSCVKNSSSLTVSIDYTLDFFVKDKLIARTVKYNYQTLDSSSEYQCRVNNNEKTDIKGYQYVCETQGNIMTVSERIKTDKYEGDDPFMDINQNVDLKGDFSNIKQLFIDNGYTCTE